MSHVNMKQIFFMKATPKGIKYLNQVKEIDYRPNIPCREGV